MFNIFIRPEASNLRECLRRRRRHRRRHFWTRIYLVQCFVYSRRLRAIAGHINWPSQGGSEGSEGSEDSESTDGTEDIKAERGKQLLDELQLQPGIILK